MYSIYYAPQVKSDIAHIPANLRNRISRAIEARLTLDPLHYGEPLRKSLKGYRKLRVGDYRVIYKIDEQNVIVLAIGHRKDIYLKYNP